MVLCSFNGCRQIVQMSVLGKLGNFTKMNFRKLKLNVNSSIKVKCTNLLVQMLTLTVNRSFLIQVDSAPLFGV